VASAARASAQQGILMVIALLIAGIVFVLAGATGIFLGIPVKEFSFGNTLILAGVVSGCTGMLTLGLAAVIRELKQIAERLESGAVTMPSSAAGTMPRSPPPENTGFMFNRDQAGPATEPAAPQAPWHEETATRGRNEPPVPPTEAASAATQRRNLMFSSSRKEGGGRAETRVTDLSAIEPRPAPPSISPAAKPAAPSLPTFEDGWQQSERARGPEVPSQRRGGRMPSTFTEPAAGGPGTDRRPPAAREEDQPAVTVIKSGIVDGMAYSLYSDGSIEAQMPEGMMRISTSAPERNYLPRTCLKKYNAVVLVS
jgi:hypothetical protein